MAFVSLFSSPPSPALDKNMTDCELTGEEREDGELEDGEIDDEGISIEEVKETKEDTEEVEKEKDKDEKPHRHSRKRHRKIKEKRRAKKSRRERKRHHSAFSGSSEDSHESDYERQDRTTSKKSKLSYRDQDGEFALRENDSGKPQRSLQHKNSDVEKHSDYSEEKYDYDDQDDFSEELSKYKQAKESLIHGKSGTPKEQGNRAKDQKFQQKFIGQRGRGRGAMGRGRGALNNMKKQKGKNWGRGRGRGGDQGGGDGDSKGPPSFQKKRPIMSQEFINQHTVEHKGRNICKYFIEGRCIKGDQCKFEHDNVVPAKKKELCKFYVQGFCTKGDICIYMHSEYPCKFFHTGAKCYQGDNCKFSHEPLTDATKELLEKVLNIEEDNGKENDLEMADLRKQGIAPIPKPPPGVGLLPTPGPGSPPDGSKKIPSLFEIKVQPTVGLAQKISLRPTFYNSTSPTTAQFQGAPQFPGNPEGLQAGGMMSPPPSSSISPHSGPLGSPPLPFTGPGIPQSPPAQPSPHGFPIPPPCPPPGFHSSLHQMIPPPLNQQGASFPPLPDGQMNAPFQKVNQMSSDFFRNLFSSQTLSHADEGPAQEPQTHGNTDSSGMQDLLPALLLHLNQNRQDSDSQREEQQGSASSSKDKDDTPNWYSSDEEEGSGVKAILNTLKKQNEMLKNQPSPATADPRLQKERALPSDPRTKPDPRQRPPDLRKEDGNGDPRTVHRIKPLDVSKHDHHPNPTVSRKPALGEDDDESERELRERTAFIPLDPNPGIKLRDPRCQIKQFSHIRVDILLQRPTFAQSVVWGPEDLIPSLIPKQEHSINLPLPPLIADAQLNRSLSSPPDHPPSATLSPPNPRLAAASFKEGIGRIGSPPGRLVDARHQDKPVDPRSLKTLDPRINRSASLDSKPPKIKETRNEKLDPRLKRASTNQSVKSESEKLPPYAPRLALSSGPSLENPTTLLGGISLYDPRNHSLLSPKHDNEEQPTKGILKSPPNPPPHDSQPQESALDTDEKSLADDSENNKDGCPSVPLLPTGISPCSQIGQAAPAVHNLPIQALAGIIRPAYNDPRQNKPVSTTGAIQPEDEEDKDSKKDRPLRDVFKTFDPTASPFFQ